MIEHARAAVRRAIDAGWAGPPFDPVALAKILKIPIVPTDAVRDARTIPTGSEGLQIEFNPNRPRGRVRYSLAHEIAHTFFADCGERIRNRAPHGAGDADGWQLEALCNIGGAELVMPVAALALGPMDRPGIEKLLEERQRFDVSTEALFIRVAQASSASMAMFVASPATSDRYRVDYLVPAPNWTPPKVGGTTLAATSVVAACASIGFTASGDESWGRDGERVHVECVGIPPYPGASAPRVAGIIWPTNGAGAADDQLLVRYVRGDACAPRADDALIVHVVNDSSPIWGSSGFAAALRRAYPGVQRSFKGWWMTVGSVRLGRVHVTEAEKGVWVASIVAQHGFGPSPIPRLRYEALHQGLEHAAAAAVAHGLSVHMPRIGSGQAGGRWAVVEELVRDSFGKAGRSVTVYDLPPTPDRGAWKVADDAAAPDRNITADSAGRGKV